MALTLAEASKLIQNPLQRGVVETFARTSSVLEYLPFMDVAGNAYSYNQERPCPASPSATTAAPMKKAPAW